MSATIELEGLTFVPGSVLRGRVKLEPIAEHMSRSVELAVLWETEGKGNTDMGVILYRVLADGDEKAAQGEHAFDVTLPFLPLTYHGVLLKVVWRARVRRFAPLAEDFIWDVPFELSWPT